jgi:4-hydroxythreonine-4-phosphate dehydrogenase
MSTIAYSVGEPGGIGADIILQLCTKQLLDDVVVVTDPKILQQRALDIGLSIELLDKDERVSGLGQLRTQAVEFGKLVKAGQADVANASDVLRVLDLAAQGCLSGEFAAMVTGPIHKGVINDAGIAFSGHTEYLAEQTGAELPVMMLATNDLRVALVTTHLPLRQVSDAISQKLVEQVIEIVDRDLKNKFGIPTPQIYVCGLNPHAGEGGHLGMEEIEVIEPAIQALKQQGINVSGPFPADTVFTPRHIQASDIIVAMYHDQGLPVLKSQGFSEAANITLGLPIIRTSVDHGTAFDLAGTGQADEGSLVTAISVARQMAAAQTQG